MEFGRARLARGAAYVSAGAAGRRLRAGARRLRPRRPAELHRPAQPRGATVAFESIDGPPPGQFHKLVQDLNDEAQTRRLAVMSRESPSAYRVRGYLAAKVVKRRDHDLLGLGRVRPRRAARAAHHRRGDRRKAGTATPGPPPTTRCCSRIARSSMDQLAAFLTSPEVAPGTPDAAEPQLALAGSQRFLAGSGRHLPHFPAQCRSGAERGRRSAGGAQRRPGAAAAAPAARGDRGIGPGNADAGGLQPLSQGLVHPVAKASGQCIWTRIAEPLPALL